VYVASTVVQTCTLHCGIPNW